MMIAYLKFLTSFQQMEASMGVPAEEPENAHPSVTHEKHATGIVDNLYHAAAVVVGAIIVTVMTFVLPKLGFS